ncbi:Dimer Tnp hAT domain-containing protein [Aphis craccivora]|uniref:Dimer Tnp hAT domain-containing protein n=1 Tax=Aphis craccivora TaxID=307492 RepID=A0A6G0W1W7_APHCR|nr:Dimer Tnp hAT domain-containing protein [Aphis craccivora]
MALTSDEDNDSHITAGSSNLTPKKKRLQRGGDILKSEKADISVIRNHAIGYKHKLMASNAKPKTQNALQTFINKSRVDPLGDKVKDAELLICSYVAAHDMPFADSKIAQALSLKRTKTKCIVKNVIGVHEKENLTKKLQCTKFSILMDESTNISSVKTACIMVRLYDEESCGIVSYFWELCQIFSEHDAQGAEEGATAENLFNKVIQTFHQRNMNVENIVGFGSDGCSTIMGKHNSVASRFQILCLNIFIMKCICHSLHLCASEACKQLPRKTEDLARDIHNFMKSSSKRQAQLAQFQKFLDLDVHKILHPSQTRLLSLIAVVERIVACHGCTIVQM